MIYFDWGIAPRDYVKYQLYDTGYSDPHDITPRWDSLSSETKDKVIKHMTKRVQEQIDLAIYGASQPK